MNDNHIHKVPPKGLGLKIWCSSCNTEVKHCLKNGKAISKCENREKLKYRTVNYLEGSTKRIVKHLDTKILSEAIKIAIKEKEKTKKVGKPKVEKIKRTKEVTPETTNELTMLEAMSYHINFLKGERGFAHEVSVKGKRHTNDVQASHVLFGKSLVKNQIEVESLLISEIGGQEVGYFHSYLLEDKNYGARTYNRQMSNLSGLFNYLNKHEGQNLINPFAKVKRRFAETKVNLMKPEEFQALLNVISKENSTQVLGTGDRKEHFHDWLKISFKMALLCGLRREQLVGLKYKDIQENEQGTPTLILSKNLKVNRIQAGKKERSIPTPITPQLRKVLIEELHYNEHKDSDKYLIAGDSKLNRDTIVNILSKSFSHYWKKTGIKKEVNFSDLRKLFINRMQLSLGDNARLVTGHQSTAVMDNHYLSKGFFAEIASKQDIFPEFDERKQELKTIRKEQSGQKISLER
jgi:integrase